MASKKYLLILGLFCLFSSYAFSQGDASYDYRDSSKIPTKRLPQHTEFTNNNFAYPAKPRSKGELGFSAGNSMIVGDVRAKANVGGSITYRRAISHVFSYRVGYYGSYNQGYPDDYERDFKKLRSYQNWTHRGGLDFIASLNTNSNYRGNPKSNIYILAGFDLIASKVFYKSITGNGQQIDKGYSVFYGNGVNETTGVLPYSVPGQPNSMAGAITTFGKKPTTDLLNNGRKGWTLLAGANIGGGIAFKLNKKVNVGFEQRFTFTPYDYLDAVKMGGSNDFYSYTSVRLNLNIGSSSKKVEPLWWINGKNYVYNELNRPQHLKLPTPTLTDTDGDGVTDQFDMEPNTPSGAAVDVRGIVKDTDNDGVPDYKDKELLTMQNCFPVNGDGVGTCPDPACCKELRDRVGALGLREKEIIPEDCGLNDLPTIKFTKGRGILSPNSIAALAKVASQVKGSPACKVKVIGHAMSDKNSQQMSWERVNAVIRYLVEKQGISQERFIFSYGEEGDPNTVELSATKEDGPNTVPAPHPNSPAPKTKKKK